MGLINYEDEPFKLSSGKMSNFKIDADFLTDDDIESIAAIAYRIIPAFSSVESIPRGGDRLAVAMEKYIWRVDTNRILICDDVITSGASFENAKGDRYNCEGLVIFDRSGGTRPWWITTIFTMPMASWV